MRRNPSAYGGIAALVVFGIGLLAVGNTWAGLCVLGLVAFGTTFALAPSAAGEALTIAVATLICSGIVGYRAASNEIAGELTYQTGIRGSATAAREQSPAKFREINNIWWGASILLLTLSGISFAFYRKFRD